jgi:hypothetical protein
MHMVPHECKEGMTVYLLGTDRKGKVLVNNGGEAPNGWPMAMVEWSDGTMQKVTIRSLQSEANYLASKPAPSPPQTIGSLIKEKLEDKTLTGMPVFVAGDKVYLRPVPPNTVRSLTELDSGEVLAGVPGKSGMFLVEWKGGRIEKLMAERLMGEVEAQQLSQSLEEEFDKVEEAVLKKMTKAAALIREANALAEKAGLELYELNDGGLLDAMENAGWRTSSMSC